MVARGAKGSDYVPELELMETSDGQYDVNGTAGADESNWLMEMRPSGPAEAADSNQGSDQLNASPPASPPPPYHPPPPLPPPPPRPPPPPPPLACNLPALAGYTTQADQGKSECRAFFQAASVGDPTPLRCPCYVTIPRQQADIVLHCRFQPQAAHTEYYEWRICQALRDDVEESNRGAQRGGLLCGAECGAGITGVLISSSLALPMLAGLLWLRRRSSSIARTVGPPIGIGSLKVGYSR